MKSPWKNNPKVKKAASLGGKARAKKLSPARRSEIAAKGAKAKHS